MKVYNGILLRAQVAAALDPNNIEFPFTRAFGMLWCGIGSEHTWQSAIRELLRAGIIHKSRQQGRLWYFKLGADAAWRPRPKAVRTPQVAQGRSGNLVPVGDVLPATIQALVEKMAVDGKATIDKPP